MTRLDSKTCGRGGLPLTLRPPPARLRLIRLVVSIVMVGPLAGAAAALLLALRRGVPAEAIAALLVSYVLTTLGVTIGFHRFFAHKAFRTSRPMQMLFVALGSMAMQGSLLYWVSTHRRHHQYSDTPDDPHSPHFRGGRESGGLAGFWHGHLGWMFDSRMTNAIRFAPDIVRDRMIFDVQRRYGLWVALGLLAPPGLYAAAGGRDLWTALAVFLWAGPLRVMLVHHASWAVGSLSHMYGRRPFETGDRSANNFWVALFAFGEGLQNNHHAFPRSARHALKWWEPDLSGVVIDLLETAHLIWDVHHPSTAAIAARRVPT